MGDELALMDAREARDCVESIKAHVGLIRTKLYELHHRKAWLALGYRSFRECIHAEFGQSESYLYRQLTAAEIEAEISPTGEIGRIPEGTVRPLGALPEGERGDAYREAVASARNGKPTAADVRAAVDRRRGRPESPRALPEPPRGNPARALLGPKAEPEPGPEPDGCCRCLCCRCRCHRCCPPTQTVESP
jgi:hypothetical protein